MAEPIKEIKLVAVTFVGGFEWRWKDKDGNEYDFDYYGSMEVDLTGHPVQFTDKPGKRRYLASVSMMLPFEQEGAHG